MYRPEVTVPVTKRETDQQLHVNRINSASRTSSSWSSLVAGTETLQLPCSLRKLVELIPLY